MVDDRPPVVGGVVVVDHPAEVPLQVPGVEGGAGCEEQGGAGRCGFEARPVVYPTKSEANVTGCDQSPYCEMYAAAPS